mmetsp:Transcript_106165/g.310338  ORF Transcript_106165/g.310338 Transcript_106165/m.310338 type:complete len:185 (+) Transcript_106165:78-632(+)
MRGSPWSLRCFAPGCLIVASCAWICRADSNDQDTQPSESTGVGQQLAANKTGQLPDMVFIPVPMALPFPLLIPHMGGHHKGAHRQNGTTTDSAAAKEPATMSSPTPAPPAGPVRKPWRCEDIKDKFTCLHAQPMFGFDCVGWGGDWCIPQLGAKCSDFTNPVLCNHARWKGLACVGWTGVSCIR